MRMIIRRHAPDDVMADEADMSEAIRQLHEWFKEVEQKDDRTRSEGNDGPLIIVDGDQ
jgi:hypothetical protein